MLIRELMRACLRDLLDSVEDPKHKQVLETTFSTIEDRFQHEGWPILDHLTDSHKEILRSLCNDGKVPSRLPDPLGLPLPNGVWEPLAIARLLGCLSWPSKLTFAGESQGSADYSGFRERSRECENFSLDAVSRLLPLTDRDRKTIELLTSWRETPRAKHGPGATYEHLYGWDKWLSMDEPTRPVIRMTDVPKDRRKRRLIGIEHAKMQFIQQGIAGWLRATPWFRRWVNLEDQEQHVRFANVPPVWGSPQRVTIDLSDASDRIPLALVEHLFPHLYPTLATASSAYARIEKSEKADYIPLGMIATMGCGFCFELETLVFHVVASLAGRISDEETLSFGRDLPYYAARCRVYGDDIIIPEHWYGAFTALASRLGWRISAGKTAVTSSFLETCGTYIFPQPGIAVKRLCPSLETSDVMGVTKRLRWTSTVDRLASAQAFVRAGFPRAAEAIAYPVLDQARYRWNSLLQRTEIKLTHHRSTTRPLNVTEELRYHAYWVCGLTDQKEEDTGKELLSSVWEPWYLHSNLLSVNRRNRALSAQSG